MKANASIYGSHNPYNEVHRVSRLRENLTSDSEGEKLETGIFAPHQSFTRQIVFKELKSGLGPGQHQVTNNIERVEKSMGIAIISYLLLIRARQKDIKAGRPGSIFQIKNNFTMNVVKTQFLHAWSLRQNELLNAL